LSVDAADDRRPPSGIDRWAPLVATIGRIFMPTEPAVLAELVG
jgi:hypothetical protein